MDHWTAAVGTTASTRNTYESVDTVGPYLPAAPVATATLEGYGETMVKAVPPTSTADAYPWDTTIIRIIDRYYTCLRAPRREATGTAGIPVTVVP